MGACEVAFGFGDGFDVGEDGFGVAGGLVVGEEDWRWVMEGAEEGVALELTSQHLLQRICLTPLRS